MTRLTSAISPAGGVRVLGVGATIMALTLVGSCGSSDAGSQEPSAGETPTSSATSEAAGVDSAARALLPDEYISKGKIVVASTFGYPPHEFFAEDNKTPMGLSIDIGDAVGKKLGVKFDFVDTSYDSIIPGIAAGRFDLAITAMSVTPERNAAVSFVVYMNEGATILVQKGNPKQIKTMIDLCGLKVGTVKGSANSDNMNAFSKSDCAPAGKKPIQVTTFAESQGPFQALSTGRIDATYRDLSPQAWAAQHSDGQLTLLPGIYNQLPVGMPIAKGDQELGKAILAGLNSVIEDGTYAQIMKKWGTESGAIDQAKFMPVTG